MSVGDLLSVVVVDDGGDGDDGDGDDDAVMVAARWR